MYEFDMKQWRKAMGWTQQRTANELGYQRACSIGQMEAGKLPISKRVILACKYLM